MLLDHESVFADICSRDIPSWEYHKEAGKVDFPTFSFEYAPSNRNKCTESGVNINKGQIRVVKMSVEFRKHSRFTLLDHFSWEWIFPLLESMKIARESENELIHALTFMEGFYICGLNHSETKTKN